MTKRLGVVIHQHRPEVLSLAAKAIAWCGSTIQPVVVESDAILLNRPDLAQPDDQFGSDLDICLSLGGDGTMLRSVSMVAEHGVPILGVNAGQLGYLAEADPAELETYLELWLAGKLQVEQRMMLEVSSPEHPGWNGYALNEAVVYRSESGRTLDVSASIDGSYFTDYLADGLMVSTPTGSTAYSLSAGGPIVQPDIAALLLTPVAAHMVFNRTMVLSPSSEVTITVKGYKPAVVALDGRTSTELQPGDSLQCRAAEISAQLLVAGTRDFHTVLKDKFGLEDR